MPDDKKPAKEKKEKKVKEPKEEKFSKRFQGVISLNGKEAVTPEVFRNEKKAISAAGKMAFAQGLIKVRTVNVRKKSVEEVVVDK